MRRREARLTKSYPLRRNRARAARRSFLFLILCALSLSLPTTLWAEPPVGASVAEAWAPPSLAGAHNGVAYFTLAYPSGPPDHLVSLSTPVAQRAELHRMDMANGVMRMRPAGAVPLKAGDSVRLAPEGLHLMLIGLKAPLKVGERFPLTLTFEHQPPLTVEVEVAAGAPRGPSR
jgi:copper(I)-binding protein